MGKHARFAVPRLEALEGRVVMDVSVASVGGGLVVTGTLGSDLLHIEQDESGEVTVLALGQTTLNGGQREVSFTDVTHLKSADLRAGNDVLNVERLGLADGAAILAGRDNDHVVLRDLDTGADVKLDLALGNDSLTLRGVRLNGNAKVTGGDGNDSALLSEVTGDGAVTVELGLGNDSLVIARSWLKQAVLHLGRGDDLFAAYDTQLTDSEVNTGIGRDLVVLVGAAMDGTANWSLGAGDDGVVARRSSFAVGSHIDGGEGLDTSVDRTGTLTTDLFKNF